MVGLLITLALAGAEPPPHDEQSPHCIRCAIDAQHKSDDGLDSPRVDRSLDDDFILVSYQLQVVPVISELVPTAIHAGVPAPPPDSLFRPPRHVLD